MMLHFIFVVREEDRAERRRDYEYARRMSRFYGSWIREKFGIEYEVACDELVTEPRSVLQRIDTHTLIRDHEQRGRDTYHFYLTYFRPLWTDCTCEGYHAENFGMAYWRTPKRGECGGTDGSDAAPADDAADDSAPGHDIGAGAQLHDADKNCDLFFAEKNCTVVSHEMLHELLRARGNKRYVQDVHDAWTKHLFSQLEFVQYDDSHRITDGRPSFLVMDTAELGLD